MAGHLIGVIDLLSGDAVHGIAGHRERYQPIQGLCWSGRVADGHPLALATWYREQFSIRNFYIADLDALQNKVQQRAAIESLIKSGDVSDRWLIDAGINNRDLTSQSQWMREVAASHSEVEWILASESAISAELIGVVAQTIDPASLVLGLDFHESRFVGPKSGLDHWMMSAEQAGVRQGLVLDVTAVGTGGGPQTASLCRSLCQRYRDWKWISGGGCRDVADVQTFRDAGCQSCLVASALLPQVPGFCSRQSHRQTE